MSTPTITFRVAPEMQGGVRQVVNAIKDDPGLTASMLELIRHPPASAGGGARNIGPFRDEDSALSFLVGRLKAALSPVAIFLFGSRAAGTERPDSDFDLLVILPGEGDGPPDYFTAYAPVAGCGLGVDIVPCRLAEFEADRHLAGTIAHSADRDGRLLYARPGGPFRERWRRQAA